MDEGGDLQARDAALQSILDPSRHGAVEACVASSMPDLRLSVRGYRLGQMLSAGGLGTNKDLDTWIALNVAGEQQ